ncbi:MAG: YraN family protein [Pseudomonadales bacterium]|nr:YraN family protein [Pseudomonadales bacterium]
MKTQILGNAAEQQAQIYLQKKGLTLIKKNYTCRVGEIDLIMEDDNCLIFIEVRLRTNPLYGTGADTVTIAKQKKIIKTAQLFLLSYDIGNRDCRFDVISIDKDIDWIQHAFTLN